MEEEVEEEVEEEDDDDEMEEAAEAAEAGEGQLPAENALGNPRWAGVSRESSRSCCW